MEKEASFKIISFCLKIKMFVWLSTFLSPQIIVPVVTISLTTINRLLNCRHIALFGFGLCVCLFLCSSSWFLLIGFLIFICFGFSRFIALLWSDFRHRCSIETLVLVSDHTFQVIITKGYRGKYYSDYIIDIEESLYVIYIYDSFSILNFLFNESVLSTKHIKQSNTF